MGFLPHDSYSKQYLSMPDTMVLMRGYEPLFLNKISSNQEKSRFLQRDFIF